MNKTLEITPTRIARFLTGIIFLLLVANFLCIYLKTAFGFNFHATNLFYFNREANVPTLYSSLAMLFSAVLLWEISKLEHERTKRHSIYWKVLAFIFLFLAVDEFTSIHENFTNGSHVFLGDFRAGGYFHFAWIFPYSVVFGIALILLLKFLYRLPVRTKKLFCAAAVIFVTGAVGLEMVGGKYVFLQGDAGKAHLTYAFIVTLEELMEMLGVVIFIYALTGYYIIHLEDKSANLTIVCKPDQKGEVPAEAINPEI